MKIGIRIFALSLGFGALSGSSIIAAPPILRFPDGISWKAVFDSGLLPKHVPGLEKTRAECKNQELIIRISGESESLVLDSGRLSIDLLNDDRVRLLMHTSRVPISMEEGEQRLNGFRKIFAKHMVRQGSMPPMMDARRGSVMTASDQFAVAKIGDHAFFYGFESSFQKELPLLCRFQLAWIPPPGDDTPLFRRKSVEPPAGYEWYSMDPKVHTPDPGSEGKAESTNDLPPDESGRETAPRPGPVEAARSVTAAKSSDLPVRWVPWILLALAGLGILIWKQVKRAG